MGSSGPETTIAPPTSNRFGAIALKRGLLRKSQLAEAISVQRIASKAGLRKRLGEILIRKGYLTPQQVRQVMTNQPAGKRNGRIGHFEIIAKLGAGAMGTVFKARQVSLNRMVALKVLSKELAESDSYRRRFIQEARSVAKLDHPHIVQAIDVGFANNEFYFAMEYVDGETLGERVVNRGGRLPEASALKYTEQIARALYHAHTHGIQHRDVKPDNILVNTERVAKLADLGLAHPRRPSRRITEFGEQHLAVGTPHYMSPEQAQGKLRLPPSSDLYSLGASLFFLLTGRPPFEGSNSQSIMAKHCTEPVPDPRNYNANLSASTAEICMKLLQKNPKDRFQDGRSLAEALTNALQKLQNPTEENTPIPVEGTRKPKRRRVKGRKRLTTGVRKNFRGLTRRKSGGSIAALLGVLMALAGTVAIVFFLRDLF